MKKLFFSFLLLSASLLSAQTEKEELKQINTILKKLDFGSFIPTTKIEQNDFIFSNSLFTYFIDLKKIGAINFDPKTEKLTINCNDGAECVRGPNSRIYIADKFGIPYLKESDGKELLRHLQLLFKLKNK